MREVHRRAELARWTTLLALPVAIVATAVAALAGVDGGNVAVLGAVTVIGVVAIAGALTRGLRDLGAIPGDVIASPAATRRAVVRRYAFILVATVAFLAALGGADGTTWWILPSAWIAYTLGGAASWAYLVRWERRHPGETPVTDWGWGRPDSYVMVSAPTDA